MIIFLPHGRRQKPLKDETIFDAALKAGIEIQSLCGGKGLCGKCKVIIVEGKENISPPTEVEMKYLSREDLHEGFRLACQTRIRSEGIVKVEVPPESRLGRQKLLEKGFERKVKLKPAVHKLLLSLKPPTLRDVEPDAERLISELRERTGGRIELSYEVLTKLPDTLREKSWEITVTLWRGREVISVESGDKRKSLYGVAVDIGTTKLAVYLVDLRSGKIVSTASDMNPQIPFGEDVISRISFVMKDELNLGRLQAKIVEGINNLIVKACRRAGVELSEIYDMTVVGNTAMHHIFLGINPKYVSLSPYTAVVGSSLDVKARTLGININGGAYVHALPVIAGFVGADAVADIIATGINENREKSMLIDIGTNTEIVLCDGENLYACSCASGPAFEGAHITHGIRAVEGAIERVWIDPETLKPMYKTVGNVKPRGICGSAIVDIIAEMLKAGIIKSNGTFNTDAGTDRLRERNGKIEFVIAPKNETFTGRDIVVTQSDIREIQLAKAAIYTGASILLKHVGMNPSEIKKLYMAGAFTSILKVRRQ